MAVIAVWKCDRDGAMFDNKKEAEQHDNMLELAENISALLTREMKEIDPQVSTEVGRVLASHRDVLAKACKGKPKLLLSDLETGGQEPAADSTVTSLPVNQ
ncbi:MAG: YebG family protein [Myxococcota bacterium]|nr:YebG family protein [Myxococcota bacterium]